MTTAQRVHALRQHCPLERERGVFLKVKYFTITSTAYKIVLSSESQKRSAQ
jgi:hypothetical protein